MNVKVIKVLLSTVTCAFLGLLTAEFVPANAVPPPEDRFFGLPLILPLGIAVGALAGFPLGMYWVSHKRRWLLIVLLNIELALSAAVGGRLGLALTATAVALTFCISAFSIRALFDDDEWASLGHHLKLVLGIVQGFQVVDDATPNGMQVTKPLLGPRLLIIRPGKAAVLERGAGRRVIQPSISTTTPFEYVKYVHDLGDQQTAYTFLEVLTQDLVSTTVRLIAQYRLSVTDQARSGLTRFTPAEQALLQRIPLAMPAWETALKTVLEQCTRRAIGSHQLEALIDGRDLDAVEQAILNRTRTRTAGWGVVVEQIIMQGVSARPGVAEAMETRRTDRERAVAMQEALAILADGYNQAQTVGMQQGDIWLEVLRRTLEQIVRELSVRRAL
jgi:regulator of protease activity HflC (stomatin/prohibitin superfamily)